MKYIKTFNLRDEYYSYMDITEDYPNMSLIKENNSILLQTNKELK